MKIHNRRVGRYIRRRQQGRKVHSWTVAISYLADNEATRPLVRANFERAFAQIRAIAAIYRQQHQPRPQLIENGRKPR